MKSRFLLRTLMMVAPVLLLVAGPATAGENSGGRTRDFKVLSPISHGNLTFFPVVSCSEP
jgi:cytochrome c oxidase assembly factor CtaG